MAGLASRSQTQPPKEEDLQELYNAVLAGFSEETPTDLHNPYSPAEDTPQSSIPTKRFGGDAASDVLPSYPVNQQSRSFPAEKAESLTRPTSQGRHASSRPLPQTPPVSGPSQPKTPQTPVVAFPEAHPYKAVPKIIPPPPPPPLPPHLNRNDDSGVTSNGMQFEPWRPSTSPNTRRLPQAPADDYSSHPYRASGLPSNPRPGFVSSAGKSSLSQHDAGPSTHPYATATPIEENSFDSPWSAVHSPDGRNSATNGHAGPDLARADSFRPKGALAPSIPGQSAFDMLDDKTPSLPSPSGSFASAGSSTNASFVLRPNHNGSVAENGRRPYSPSQAPASLLPSQPTLRASFDDLRDPFPAFNHLTASSTRDSPPLGRGLSTGSTQSTQSPGTDTSISSPPTSVFTNGETALGHETNTTVDRGNSFNSLSSYTSGVSNESSNKPSENQLDTPLSHPSITVQPTDPYAYDYPESSNNNRINRANELQRVIMTLKGPLELHEDDELDYDDEYDEEDENRFFNLALLSHLAVRLRDKVPRGTQVKGGIPYPHAFTGKDIVSTIQSQIQRELLLSLGISTQIRRPALQVARSLQSQLFFYEVEWGGRVLQDDVNDVYMFLDDQEGGAEARLEREELPTGVFTLLTKCYSPSCVDGSPCYSYSCPRKEVDLSRTPSLISNVDPAESPRKKEWTESMDEAVLKSIPDSEINRQTIIHKAIEKEALYVQDLDMIEAFFIKPIRSANPPLIRPEELDGFMDDVFGNILDLRECNRRLLEVMAVRQREQSPIIERIGDVFLTAAAEFRLAYPIYVGNLPVAEKRLKDELEHNVEFRRFVEHSTRQPELRRLDLKTFLNRPSEHLQKYPVLLEAIFNETMQDNGDAEFLLEAIQAIRKLSTVAQLRTFQSAMGKGPTGKLEWHDLVPMEIRAGMSKQEAKRQSIIFELIKTEMQYVKDLEHIETLYIRPLTLANPPIVSRDRLSSFLHDVFYNYAELRDHHRKLCERLHEIQREEHPMIRSITAPVLDAALNWRDAYMEYIPHYPIAWYRIDEELANNLAFKTFADQTQRQPDARKLDMKTFVNRPIPRLLRYELLLSGILAETPPNHEDRDTIPQAIEIIKALGKETQPGVKAAEEKVELWRYNQNLVFKPGEAIDMDLLDENRSLVYSGKLLRQPETGFEWSGWGELFVLLFDNYLVFTKPKEKDGVTKYHVNRRPIPLDLLTLVNFTDPPQQRGKGILGGLRGGERGGGGHVDPNGPGPNGGPDSTTDSRSVFPCTIHHNGRLGGVWTVYAETTQARVEWKQKLEEAILLRKVVTDANKVFEIETLSADTFLVPSMHAGTSNPSWNDENTFTGKVTCSVPFSTVDGRGLVAIGCAEGVWIGLRHDPRSMRRVLHLKMVTQCAMLEDFGIFLVLADKALFAYHIEALVPSSPPSANATRTPQKLNGNKDVQFFSVGTLGGRTLIIYMKKKGLDSVFRVLEPVVGKIAEKTKAPGGLSRFGFGSQRSEWFRVFRDFFLPSESYDLIFLKAKIAILCSKGFEIMDLTDFKSVTIPSRDDPRLAALAKRCESCRPMGMFRSSENEFLLCYDEFGIYVDRHGDPSRTIGTIEWEGTAERVAWHPPYVLLFDTRFIEVRHVETGRLAQIIPGNDVRCLWDGRGANLPPVTTPGPDGWQDGSGSQEARVHAVMKGGEFASGRPTRAVAQHVFQLVPTIPLYLPGSLSSPSHSTTYFPQSQSPPQSPQVTPRHSWR